MQPSVSFCGLPGSAPQPWLRPPPIGSPLVPHVTVFKQAPPDSAWFDYEWDFSSGGIYRYLVVAWLAEGENLFDFDAWVEIGFYPDPGSPDHPGEVLITPGVYRRIDLTGDFSRVPGGGLNLENGKR